MPDEQAKLEQVEDELRVGEARLEHAKPSERIELEEEQEEKVSFYHKLKGLFAKEHKVEEAYEEIEQVTPQVDVTEDFRRLAQIQMRWFDRMPTRVKQEFKESDDYGTYVEILSRRGVAKKK